MQKKSHLTGNRRKKDLSCQRCGYYAALSYDVISALFIFALSET